jgi:hypothetical protein
MSIGTSLFLIAVGAIMRYAVNTDVDGFSINTAGAIFMIVGAIGLLLSLLWLLVASDRRRDPYAGPRDVV